VGGYVRRRDFIKVIAGSAAWPFVARAQQPTSTIRRIGILLPESASAAGDLLEAFRQGLKEMGWVEGQNIAFESRSADGKGDALPFLMVTAISGNHHRIDFMIGPGKALDPDKYFIIATDAISNGFTTSPSNSKLQPRMSFPKFTIRDMVESQYRFVKGEVRNRTSGCRRRTFNGRNAGPAVGRKSPRHDGQPHLHGAACKNTSLDRRRSGNNTEGHHA
jgi:hypothetical protein